MSKSLGQPTDPGLNPLLPHHSLPKPLRRHPAAIPVPSNPLFLLSVLLLVSAVNCQLDCGTVKNTVANSSPYTINDVTMCFCNYGFVWDVDFQTCSPSDCSSPNLLVNGYSTDHTECKCLSDNYKWNAEMGWCEISCTTLGNTQNIPVSDPEAALDSCTCYDSCNFTSNFNPDQTPTTLSASCQCLQSYCSLQAGSSDPPVADPQPTTTQLTCQCKSAFDWVASTGQCTLNCGKVTHATTVNPASPTNSCLCASPYEWSQTLFNCVLNCAKIPSANGADPSSSQACLCLPSFVWNSSTPSCDLDCPNIPFTDQNQGFDGLLTKTSCACLDGYYWNTSLFVCLVNCQSLGYTDQAYWATVQNNDCKCNHSVFYWDATNLQCLPNCSLVSNVNSTATPTNDLSCTCNSPYLWSLADVSCNTVVNCALIANADYSSILNGTTCICKINFVWTASPPSCIWPCQGRPYVNSSAPLGNNGECVCLAPYHWNATTSACEVNCSEIDYPWIKRKSPQINSTTCRCHRNFVWNGTKGCSINCSSIVDSNHGRNSRSFCTCRPGFFWQDWHLGCILNCSVIANTNNTVPLGNWGLCVCNYGYSWDNTQLKCARNCSQVANANLSAQGTDCVCKTGYYLASPTVCTFNCTGVANSIGADPYSTTRCLCKSRFVWSSPNCQIDCRYIPNSYGALNTTACNCLSTYFWASNLTTCLKNCSTIPNTNLSATLPTGQCQCKSGYLLLSNSVCQLNCPSVKNAIRYDPTNPSRCICNTISSWDAATTTCKLNCSYDSRSTGVGIEALSACECKPKYKWVYILNRCQINCGSITNAIAPITIDVCSCFNKYIWNSNLAGCVVDCRQISWTNGQPSVQGACTCLGNRRWSAMFLACL